jgi:hypothetical protein
LVKSAGLVLFILKVNPVLEEVTVIVPVGTAQVGCVTSAVMAPGLLFTVSVTPTLL